MNKPFYCLMILLAFNRLHAQQKVLFLVAGQSNAVGVGNSTESVQCTRGTAFEYRFSKDTLLHLQDPVGANELKFGAANTGSIHPAFAKTFAELSKKQVVVVSAARSGASCHYKAELDNYGTWDETGRLRIFDDAVLKTKKASKKVGVKLNGIIWLQGERDANAINAQVLTAQEYEEALRKLIQRFRAKFGRKVGFYIVQTGYYTDHPQTGFDQVRLAQKNVAKRLKNTHIVYENTHLFKEKGWLHDAIHYNQTALNDIGEATAKYILTQPLK
jgi:Carbohydrate esterase, sialic acid-specific acetylesterase